MKLLAILTDAESAETCLNAAAAAARMLEIPEIEVLHVLVDPANLIGSAEEVDIQWLRSLREGTPEQRSEAVKLAFSRWLSRSSDGLLAVWHEVEGSEAQQVTEAAKDADISTVVLADEQNLDAADARHAALFSLQKPVLLVPHGWSWSVSADRRFRHVAVAVDGAALRHSIEPSLRMLQNAERITCIHVGTDVPQARKSFDWLEEKGLTFELRFVEDQAGTGKAIVAEAELAGADLLMAGAYRHSEIAEGVQRGITHQILTAADLPLLLIH